MNSALLGKCILIVILLASLLPARTAFSQGSNDPVDVVATFSILGDLVQHIGGDRITLHVLVGANSDGHVYQPTPADARLLREAELVIANGLGFEGWIDRLIQASGYQGAVIIASTGIVPLNSVGGHEQQPDPHAWQDLANVRIYIDNILKSLSKVAPEHQQYFAANAATLIGEIDALEKKIQMAVAVLPVAARTIVTSHDAFAYFGKAYGFRFIAPVGISTDSEASATDVARLIEQIRRDKIHAVFVENITDQRLLTRIAHETGATIGGTLYSDALSDSSGPATTYIRMMSHNLETITAALR
jgi:zinc/manganese transport system substrate-binding protein